MIGIVAATSLTLLAACGRGGSDSSSSSTSSGDVDGDQLVGLITGTISGDA